MVRGSTPADGSVLPPSRITNERLAGLSLKFMPVMPDRETVVLGKARPAPQYPFRSIFFLSFSMAVLSNTE
uniref:Uncharacterized protein n=1 Tax=Oryza punctata TaxID=4537 RepID=A0A0E0JLI8_ORYPU